MENRAATDHGWAVWFRNGSQPNGRWCCWEYTAASTRKASIAKFVEFWGPDGAAEWERRRRQGLVTCRRTLFTAPSFGDPRFP